MSNNLRLQRLQAGQLRPQRISTSEDSLVLLKLGLLRAFSLVAVVLIFLALLRTLVADATLAWPQVIIALLLVYGYFNVPRNPALWTNVLMVLPAIAALLVTRPQSLAFVAVLGAVIVPIFASRFVYGLFLIAVLVRAATYDAAGVFLFSAGLLIDTNTVFASIVLIVSMFVRAFSERLQRIANESRRNAELLNASASIGQLMGQFLDLKPLLDSTVDAIRDRLGFYHVQVFFSDEASGAAVLVASTGEAGRKLLERQHKIMLGSNSVVGRVIQAAEPVVASDTRRDEGHAFNELLPYTRSEIAIPIIDGDTVIGALDVQSMRVEAFSRNEIQALQVMTAQLATAIRNARLFESQAQAVRENKRLFIEAETSLRENQRLTRQLTKQSWEQYLKTPGIISGVTLENQAFQPGASWSERMLLAGQRRQPSTSQEAERRTIAVPIELRNEVIGAIEIELHELTASTSDAIDMMQALSTRLAVSLDNARLFEETQEATAQEQRIGEIVTGYQSASGIEDLLQITLMGLYDALGATAGAIRLGALTDEPEPRPDAAPAPAAHANGAT